MRGATLLYKCRVCGEITKTAHVPDGMTASLAIEGIMVAPSTWFGVMHKTSVHSCSAVLMGVTDYAGVEFDRPEAVAEG